MKERNQLRLAAFSEHQEEIVTNLLNKQNS